MNAGLLGAEPLPPAARKAMIAGCVGFAVDFFDIYLPVLALAPVTKYFEPPGLSPTTNTTIYFFIFAATLLGRPCGAVIFGHWADRIGRRRVTMISIVGFGTLTLLIACLPGYATIGVASLLLLIVLRFVGGVFMGGEYTSNNALALEIVPKGRRGFVGGILQGAYPIGFFFVSMVTSILLSVTTPAIPAVGLAPRLRIGRGPRLPVPVLLCQRAGIAGVARQRKEPRAAHGRRLRSASQEPGADLHHDGGLLVRIAVPDRHHAGSADPAPAHTRQARDQRSADHQLHPNSSPSSASGCWARRSEGGVPSC